MKPSAIQVHKPWLLRMVLVLTVMYLVDAIGIWYLAHLLLWATLVPATFPLFTLFFVAPPLLKRGEEERSSRRSRSRSITAIIFEAVFFPIFIVLGILAVKRKRDLQAKRIEEYRRSPKSRLIRLVD